MKKRCFTFVEIIGVMAVIGLLFTGTVTYINRVWQNNRIDICESELREITGAFKSFYTDYGNFTAEPDSNYETVINETVNLLNKKYLPYEIETDEIAEDKKSLKLKTKIKKDPWNNNYKLIIYTFKGEDEETVPGLVIIISGGKDAEFNSESYAEGIFGDDIIAVIEPNL